MGPRPAPPPPQPLIPPRPPIGPVHSSGQGSTSAACRPKLLSRRGSKPTLLRHDRRLGDEKDEKTVEEDTEDIRKQLNQQGNCAITRPTVKNKCTFMCFALFRASTRVSRRMMPREELPPGRIPLQLACDWRPACNLRRIDWPRILRPHPPALSGTDPMDC